MDWIFILWSIMLIVFGIIISISDIKTKKIPNNIVITMIVAWLITIIPMLIIQTPKALVMLQDSIFGFLMGGGFFLLVYVISKKGLGGGDVKFMAASGLYLGFHGVIPTMFCGSLLAAGTAIVLILLKKIKRNDSIPLAPFLFTGMLLTIFFV